MTDINQRARDLVDHVTDYLCEQEYDIGGRDELRKHVAAALAGGEQRLSWVSPFGSCVCNGEYACPACNPNEAIALARTLAAQEERLKHPPCVECGATSPQDGRGKCICAGDKDDCHGCQLWPDGAARAQQPAAALESAVTEALKDGTGVFRVEHVPHAEFAPQPATVGVPEDDDDEPVERFESGLADCGPAVAWDSEGIGACERCAKELGWIETSGLQVEEADSGAADWLGQVLGTLGEATPLEALSESEKETALAQAVTFAEYVERQAKGEMVKAAKRFLSLPYAQEVATRLGAAKRIEESQLRVIAGNSDDTSGLVTAFFPAALIGRHVRLVLEHGMEGATDGRD